MDDHDALSQVAEPRPASEVVRQLVSRCQDFLVFLERRVGSRAVAEDILQDAFVRGLDKLESLRNEESAMAWFYRVLRNVVVDHHRRRESANRSLKAFAAELDRQSDPDAGAQGAICQCVTRLAGTLKPEYAEALKRIEIDGIPVKEYAIEAGISSGNAAVRVFRARQALRNQVARSCGTCAAYRCLDCT